MSVLLVDGWYAGKTSECTSRSSSGVKAGRIALKTPT